MATEAPRGNVAEGETEERASRLAGETEVSRETEERQSRLAGETDLPVPAEVSRHLTLEDRVGLLRAMLSMRGAWLWPAFFALTAIDGALIALLPPYEESPREFIGGALLAGFANLAAIAVLAPLGGHLLRRRRPDLPRVVANDYAGTALVLVIAALLLMAGLIHRPAVSAERGDQAAMLTAVRGFVTSQAPEWRPGLERLDAVRLAPDTYRACVPGDDPRRSLCLIVDTDQRPAGVTRDDSMEPN